MTQVRGNKLALNIADSVLTLVLAAAGVLLAHQLPHYTPFAEWHPLALLLSLCVIIPVHELLHAVGAMWFGNIAWRDLKFGVLWRALTPYCHCRVPIRLQAYRRVTLLPFWGTGVPVVILLFLFPTAWFGAFAGITIAACVGDFWVVWKLRQFTDANALVQDSPTEIGCDVYSAGLNKLGP